MQAYNMLRPGGYIAMSDFTVRPEHSAITRSFWPAVFKSDGIRPCTDHVDTLRAMFREVACNVESGGFPYVPLLEAPYYYFVGQKK